MPKRLNALEEHLDGAGIRGEVARIVILRQLEGLGWREIGALLELQPRTVQAIYTRANRRLIQYRERMGAIEEPDPDFLEALGTRDELQERAQVVYEQACRGPLRCDGHSPPLPSDPRSNRTGVRSRVLLLDDVRNICREADARRSVGT